MAQADGIPEIGADDFARRFSLRAPNLMWLLGAGASAAAGIPTASDMVWEFKQRLFISQRRVSAQAVSDLSSGAVRAQLQAHIDGSERLSAVGAPDEYATLFEAVYPAEADRRAYMDAKMAGARPSYGHLAVATLMRAGRCPIVWTTNFDPMVADACARVFGTTGPLTTVALDAPVLAAQLIGEARWPLEIKLHGDFRSRRLKNTPDELRQQDARLRQVLIDCCRRYGLVVAGYSGRDGSVMDALEEALEADGAYPAGLFWLHRGEDEPFQQVGRLLTRAADAGVEASLVHVDNFDEALRDVVRLLDGLDTAVLDDFAAERRRWSGAPRPAGARGFPVVRLNALQVAESPTVCRRVVCSIGGYSEIAEAVKQAGVDILYARVQSGVLAFGADADVRAALEDHNIDEFDLHTIETNRLRYDSGERGLLRDAIARAVSRDRRLLRVRRRSSDLLYPADAADPAWIPLRGLVGELTGTVAGHPELAWHEGIGTRLDWADDKLWLLIEPRTVFSGIDEDNKGAVSDFARERSVQRYNRQLNELIDFWSHFLCSDGGELRALGITDGVDAVFRLSQATAFSRRVRA
ncbi:MAG: SIR2 family protein [Actinobacteria bacterium]|nr:MAG: SIR2 family protein [Actinomycetota bacterium]